MSCKNDCGFPIKPAPFAPADPGPHHPPLPPRPPVPCGPCPPSQYIGSRYVPIFADPIEWDNHRSYESLTIVTHDGESYTSKCNVGPGVDITNTRYWAKTGAYNAQVEQYKNEVKDLSSQVSGFASDNAEFREKIDQFTKDNAEMKNTVAEDKARVDALAERVATAETEIDGLQATTAQHTTEIADLHAGFFQRMPDLRRVFAGNQLPAGQDRGLHPEAYRAETGPRRGTDHLRRANVERRQAIQRNGAGACRECCGDSGQAILSIPGGAGAFVRRANMNGL